MPSVKAMLQLHRSLGRACPIGAGLMALTLMSPSPVQAQNEPIALDPPRLAQAPEPLCFCWNDGRKIAEGASSCIRTTQGRRLATCGRAENIMSWGISESACPES